MLRNEIKNILRNLSLLVIIIGAVSCADDDTNFIEEAKDEEEVLEENNDNSSFQGPRYADDYTPIASWQNKDSWNLANIHDPNVASDGTNLYMVQTDASYGNALDGHGHFPIRTSTNLVNWEFQGTVFPEVPSWVKDSLNSMRAQMDPPLPAIENPQYGFWAPAISEVNGVFRVYYSIVIENTILGNIEENRDDYWTERAFIGLAESTNPASGQWEDKGMVISSIPDGLETYTRSSGADWSGYFKYNAIDPSFIEAVNGEQWLIYGSWHSGIVAVQLNPSTGKPFQLNNLADYGTRIAGRGNVNENRWQALEAPEIIYNEETGYYYLFLAYDELAVAYNTRVARSQNITGPYYGINGGNVTEGAEALPVLTHPYAFNDHTGWVGISHCAVFKDETTGKWFYASQGRLPIGVEGINESNAVMMGHVREIYWTDDGWPVVAPERYANVPDDLITEEQLIGNWEQITLRYQYQTIQRSVNVILNEDHSVTGEINGTWSFSESSQHLSINNHKFIVDNAWDWEASPRKLTITFAGISDEGFSIWGKKSQD